MKYVKKEHIELEVEDILNIIAQSIGALWLWNKYRHQPRGHCAELVNKPSGRTHLVVSEDISYHGSPTWDVREDDVLEERDVSRLQFLINLEAELNDRHAARVSCEL